MNNLFYAELKESEAERKNMQEELASKQQGWAEMIKNGYGAQICNEIDENAHQCAKKENKLTKFIRRILNTL